MNEPHSISWRLAAIAFGVIFMAANGYFTLSAVFAEAAPRDLLIMIALVVLAEATLITFVCKTWDAGYKGCSSLLAIAVAGCIAVSYGYGLSRASEHRDNQVHVLAKSNFATTMARQDLADAKADLAAAVSAMRFEEHTSDTKGRGPKWNAAADAAKHAKIKIEAAKKRLVGVGPERVNSALGVTGYSKWILAGLFQLITMPLMRYGTAPAKGPSIPMQPAQQFVYHVPSAQPQTPVAPNVTRDRLVSKHEIVAKWVRGFRADHQGRAPTWNQTRARFPEGVMATGTVHKGFKMALEAA